MKPLTIDIDDRRSRDLVRRVQTMHPHAVVDLGAVDLVHIAYLLAGGDLIHVDDAQPARQATE